MKNWKAGSITTAAVLAATLGAGLTARAATPESAVRASRTGLAVSVMGPQTVRVGASCTWLADVSGGTAPYTDRWTTFFSQEFTPSSDLMFTHTFETMGPDMVQVEVMDVWQNTVTTSINVMVVDENDPAECT